MTPERAAFLLREGISTGVLTLLQEPSYLVPWLRTLLPSKHPNHGLPTPSPWMPFSVVSWLENHITKDFAVFEYGSGASSLFFASRAGSLISVEHHPAWHREVEAMLEKNGYGNARCLLREPVPNRQDSLYRSEAPTYSGYCFESYVKAIDSCADRSLDLVIVDGRAREACIRNALPKIRSGGWLVLDNSQRPRYSNVKETLSHFERHQFVGVTPFQVTRSTTTIWLITHSA